MVVWAFCNYFLNLLSEELLVRLPPLGGGGEDGEVKEQLADVLRQSAVDAPLKKA